MFKQIASVLIFTLIVVIPTIVSAGLY